MSALPPLSHPSPHPTVDERALQAERTAFIINLAAVIVGWMVTMFMQVVFSYAAPGTATFVTITVMWLGLVWRRRNAQLMLTLVTLAGIGQLLLIPYPTASVVVIPLAVYSYARWVPGRRSRLVLILGAAAALVGPLSWVRGMVPSITEEFATSLTFYVLAAVVCGGMVLTPYAIGRRMRETALIHEQRRRSEAQRHAAQLAEHQAAARMAEVRARSQIARELHDIVAHSLSVMIVQAEGGRALAAKRPEHAAEVLGTIAETGRDALGEMRRIVGVLRGEDQGRADYRPTPGLGDIADMAERAGDRVQFEVRGALPQVPPTLGLTAYRIAQEGVTNFLKHAGPEATCQVLVTCLPEMIVVEVSDNGVGSAASDGAGHGLRGMAERVSAMGGELLARPKRQGGFLVRALLPLTGSPPSRTGKHPRTPPGPDRATLSADQPPQPDPFRRTA